MLWSKNRTQIRRSNAIDVASYYYTTILLLMKKSNIIYSSVALLYSVGRRLEKNYLFCEPCFLSLFRPLFVRYIIGNIRLIYRTNCALSRTKKHAQVGYFRLIYRTNCDLSTRKISRIFPTLYRTNCALI